jgi:hypothetical protein
MTLVKAIVSILFSTSGPLHCKKRLGIFLSPAVMSPKKTLSGGDNIILPVQREFGL